MMPTKGGNRVIALQILTLIVLTIIIIDRLTFG